MNRAKIVRRIEHTFAAGRRGAIRAGAARHTRSGDLALGKSGKWFERRCWSAALVQQNLPTGPGLNGFGQFGFSPAARLGSPKDNSQRLAHGSITLPCRD